MDQEAIVKMIEFLTSENIRLQDENNKLKTKLAGLELLIKAKGVDIDGER